MATEREMKDMGIDPEDLSYTDEDTARIEADPIRITLSGHTCAGKTEWLSSLLCAKVGDTSPQPDTTREITWTTRSLAGRDEGTPYIKIADVPGQQFSSEILKMAQKELGQRPRPRQMEDFIERHKEAKGDHQSDIGLLDHFRGCDVILYLADAKDMPAVAIEDEFELVRRLGCPVIAVLNFSSPHFQTDRSTLDQWREAFELEGARSVVELDAFDKDPAAIRELGAQLTAVFHDQPLKAKFMRKYWQEEIIAKEDQRVDKAVNTLAEFLVDAATYRVKESLGKGKGQKATEKRVTGEFQEFALRKIAMLPGDIMEAYPEFTSALASDAEMDQDAPDGHGILHAGPFGDVPGRQIPKSLGRGAIIGGLIGLAIDAAFGGVSGGGGTILGASFGAVFDVWFSLKVKKTSLGHLGSYMEVQLAERTLKTCCVDGLALIDALRRRGVGNCEPLNFKTRRQSIPSPDKIMKSLEKKQDRHAWSRWSDEGKLSSRRQAFVDELATELRELLDRAGEEHARGRNVVARAGNAVLGTFTAITRRVRARWIKED